MAISCGQSLDMFSKLPDALLVKILSSLPTTKEVVATTVLSKQWRSLWKMVPKLTFNCNGDNNDVQGFLDSVRRTMLSLEAPYLQSLHLDVSLDKDDRIDDFGELVGIACGLNVRELVLKLKLLSSGFFLFPISLYNYQTLETLKLCGVSWSMTLVVPSQVCLKSLRTLQLEDLSYEDDESVVNLLAGCISLENLFVTRNRFDGVETFTIAVPSLQELTIENGVYWSDYVINSPSLKKLMVRVIADNRIRSESMRINAPELVEATIWTNDEFLLGESLTSVKRLSLSIKDMEVPAGCNFSQLEHLQLFTGYLLSWNPLMVMLDNSPNLQVLEIISEHYDGLTWKQPKHVPHCLLHLKTLDWYIEKLTYGKEVAKYILSNAKSLENANLRMDSDLYDYFPNEERLEVCHDIKEWCPDDCKFELISGDFRFFSYRDFDDFDFKNCVRYSQ